MSSRWQMRYQAASWIHRFVPPSCSALIVFVEIQLVGKCRYRALGQTLPSSLIPRRRLFVPGVFAIGDAVCFLFLILLCNFLVCFPCLFFFFSCPQECCTLWPRSRGFDVKHVISRMVVELYFSWVPKTTTLLDQSTNSSIEQNKRHKRWKQSVNQPI